MKVFVIGCIGVVLFGVGVFLFFGSVVYNAFDSISEENKRYQNLPEVEGILLSESPLKGRLAKDDAAFISYKVIKTNMQGGSHSRSHKSSYSNFYYFYMSPGLRFLDKTGQEYSIKNSVNKVPFKAFLVKNSTKLHFETYLYAKSDNYKPQHFMGINDRLDCTLTSLTENLKCGAKIQPSRSSSVEIHERIVPLGRPVVLKAYIDGDELILVE